MSIDWDEKGTLRNIAGDYLIREDPLWLLIVTAIQGHEGLPEDLLIATASGATFCGDEIRQLARRPDRKRG
jgi:hypothetical protein